MVVVEVDWCCGCASFCATRGSCGPLFYLLLEVLSVSGCARPFHWPACFIMAGSRSDSSPGDLCDAGSDIMSRASDDLLGASDSEDLLDSEEAASVASMSSISCEAASMSCDEEVEDDLPMRPSTGSWLGPAVLLVPQSQALVAKAYSTIKGLPKALTKRLCAALGWPPKVTHIAREAQITMSVFDCSRKRLRKIIGKKSNFPESCPRDIPLEEKTWAPKADRDREVLDTLCQRGLACAVEGDSALRFAREVARLSIERGLPQMQIPRNFYQDVTGLGCMALQQIDHWFFQRALPGLGIPSDCAFMADPVSLGLSVRARHDVVMVLCVCLVSSFTGKLHSRMWDGWSMPFGGHSGVEMCRLILKMLASHPASFDLAALRRRLAALIGDGQLTVGGPDARNKKRPPLKYLLARRALQDPLLCPWASSAGLVSYWVRRSGLSPPSFNSCNSSGPATLKEFGLVIFWAIG